MAEFYNGSQSKLEYYAINGHPSYPNSGRNVIINHTKIGNGKYTFNGPYKNPQITGDENSQYGISNTNALADEQTPYNGRGTGDGVTNGVFGAIYNYNGGNYEDKNGAPNISGSGRTSQIIMNASIFGYGPSQIAGENYIAPDMSGNIGQIIID